MEATPRCIKCTCERSLSCHADFEVKRSSWSLICAQSAVNRASGSGSQHSSTVWQNRAKPCWRENIHIRIFYCDFFNVMQAIKRHEAVQSFCFPMHVMWTTHIILKVHEEWSKNLQFCLWNRATTANSDLQIGRIQQVTRQLQTKPILKPYITPTELLSIQCSETTDSAVSAT